MEKHTGIAQKLTVEVQPDVNANVAIDNKILEIEKKIHELQFKYNEKETELDRLKLEFDQLLKL